MTSDQRFERELPDLLADLYMAPMPTYRDEVLRESAGTRQRPAWTFLSRWLPTVEIARRLGIPPPIPWRSIGLAALLAGIILAMLAALIVGSRPRIPAPFGPARTGLVAYADDGEIYTVDTATGISTAVVTGPATDIDPRWSLDGTHFAFERKVDGDLGPGWVYIARADGTGLVQITREPIPGITRYAFSPDGQEVLISGGPSSSSILLIAAADGSAIRELDVGSIPATNAAWRPPDGTEILFADDRTSSRGLYAVNADGGNIRTIVEPVTGRYRDQATWSQDGSKIAYMEWGDATSITSRIHVIAADGTGDQLLPMPSEATWELARGWSNDGTRLLAVRGYSGDWNGSRLVAIPVDGSGFGVEIGDPNMDVQCCSVWEWAPDDTSILGTPADPQGRPREQVLLDPVAGTATTVPWTTSSLPSWQRLAP
jgi:dipeptidyl aminopeptidase/acylaminoacyl peptidase